MLPLRLHSPRPPLSTPGQHLAHLTSACDAMMEISGLSFGSVQIEPFLCPMSDKYCQIRAQSDVSCPRFTGGNISARDEGRSEGVT